MLLSLCLSVKAQINGRVVDANGYAIPYASVAYKGHQVAVSSDVEGRFTIERHNGWVLTISSLGFKSQVVKVDNDTKNLEIKLKEDSHKLDEVVVKSRRGKYSRKDNPAVELMRRVIAAKKKTDLQNHDYYQYDKYQKLTMAVNDIKPEQLENGFFKKRQYLIDQVEVSPYNNKLTLPLSVDETVTQHLYRKNPHKERDIIKGQQSTGIGNILQTGDVINTTLKELFTDVDIYDDHVRLLQYPFPSPIGRTAISFYHFTSKTRSMWTATCVTIAVYSRQLPGLRLPWRTLCAGRLVAPREAMQPLHAPQLRCELGGQHEDRTGIYQA